MPPKTRKLKTKRRPRKRYRSLISRGVPSGMPTIRRANLRYVAKVNLILTGNNLREYVFRANSIFQPDGSGTGHQPMGHDEWGALYKHYVVLGSKCTTLVNQSDSVSNTSNLTAVGSYVHNALLAPYEDFSEFAEARKGQYKTVSAISTRSMRLTNTFSAKNFFHVTDVNDNIRHLGALVGSNPSDAAYYHIWAQSLDPSVPTNTEITFLVTIDYIVEYSEPNSLIQS